MVNDPAKLLFGRRFPEACEFLSQDSQVLLSITRNSTPAMCQVDQELGCPVWQFPVPRIQRNGEFAGERGVLRRLGVSVQAAFGETHDGRRSIRMRAQQPGRGDTSQTRRLEIRVASRPLGRIPWQFSPDHPC